MVKTRHSKREGAPPARQREIVRLRHANLRLDLRPGARLGRDAVGKDFLARFPKVSREHLVVHRVRGRWFVQDLETPNGTCLNGVPLDPERWYEVRTGDRLWLARELEFLVVLVTDPDGAGEPESPPGPVRVQEDAEIAP